MAKTSTNTNFFNPETFTSGLVDQIELTITAATVVEYDFNGKAANGNACAVNFTLTTDEGEAHEQYYPVGQIEHWVPTEDGDSFVPVTGKTGINKNAPMAQFIANALKGGFPKTKLSSNVSTFVGYKFFFEQKAREGAKVEEGKQAKTLLVPTKLVAAPGEKGSKAKAGATNAKAKAAAAAADDEEEGEDDFTATAIRVVKETIAAADGAIDAETVASDAYGIMMKDKTIDKATRKKILDAIDADFLAENAGKKTWAWDADEEKAESH